MPDPSVRAFIPLSLLEAIRNMDTPVEDGLEELTGELVTRKLGLSTTVAAQIERYRRGVERGEPVPLDEALSVFRLVGRRPDAPLVYADAGRRAARYARRGEGGGLRRVAPAAMGRRLGARAAVRVARRALGAELTVVPGGPAEARMADPLSVAALPDGRACSFYGAAFGELLRGLTGFEGAVEHPRCRGRGDESCLWAAAPGEDFT